MGPGRQALVQTSAVRKVWTLGAISSHVALSRSSDVSASVSSSVKWDGHGTSLVGHSKAPETRPHKRKRLAPSKPGLKRKGQKRGENKHFLPEGAARPEGADLPLRRQR